MQLRMLQKRQPLRLPCRWPLRTVRNPPRQNHKRPGLRSQERNHRESYLQHPAGQHYAGQWLEISDAFHCSEHELPQPAPVRSEQLVALSAAVITGAFHNVMVRLCSLSWCSRLNRLSGSGWPCSLTGAAGSAGTEVSAGATSAASAEAACAAGSAASEASAWASSRGGRLKAREAVRVNNQMAECGLKVVLQTFLK